MVSIKQTHVSEFLEKRKCRVHIKLTRLRYKIKELGGGETKRTKQTLKCKKRQREEEALECYMEFCGGGGASCSWVASVFNFAEWKMKILFTNVARVDVIGTAILNAKQNYHKHLIIFSD